jgi:hypothetical protein
MTRAHCRVSGFTGSVVSHSRSQSLCDISRLAKVLKVAANSSSVISIDSPRAKASLKVPDGRRKPRAPGPSRKLPRLTTLWRVRLPYIRNMNTATRALTIQRPCRFAPVPERFLVPANRRALMAANRFASRTSRSRVSSQMARGAETRAAEALMIVPLPPSPPERLLRACRLL